jgi:hypothetical protein
MTYFRFIAPFALLLCVSGCNTTNLENAAPVAPATPTATAPTVEALPTSDATLTTNDPFMLEVIGSCRIKVAADAGAKTEDVVVGPLTPAADGNGQYIIGVVGKDKKKFRCSYDNIGNFLGAKAA